MSFTVVRASNFRQFAGLPSALRNPQFNRSPSFTVGIFDLYGRAAASHVRKHRDRLMAQTPRIVALFGARVFFGQERANVEALAALRGQGCEVLCAVRHEIGLN